MEDKYSVIGIDNGFERVINEGITFNEALQLAEETRKHFDSVSISLDYNMRSPSQNMLVFSDVEMMLPELKRLLTDRPDDLAEQLVFLGNFISGDDGFTTFMDYLLRLKALGRDMVLVRGQNEHNVLEAIHETEDYVGDRERYEAVIAGIEEQLGFSLVHLPDRRPEYYQLLNNSYTYFEDDQHIFVSAGLDLSGPWRESAVEDMYLPTDRFKNAKNETGKTIVFGTRSVVDLNSSIFRKPWINTEDEKIGINGDIRNYGRLIAISIIEGERYFIGVRHRKRRIQTYAYDVFALN